MSLTLLLAALKLATLTAAAKVFPVALDIDKPPAAVAALVKQLKDPTPEKRAAAAKQLAARDDAAPYIRDLFFGAMHVPQPHRAAILTELDARRHARNAARAVRWADQRRADMLAEYGCMDATETQLPGQIEPVIRLTRVASESFAKIGPKQYATRWSILRKTNFNDFSEGMARFAGERVKVPHDLRPTNTTLVQARYWDNSYTNHSNWICLVRDDLRDSLRSVAWHNSVFVFNNTAPRLADLTKFDDSLVVVAGDLELPAGGTQFDGSMVVVDGAIRAASREQYIYRSYVWAADGIDLPGKKNVTDDELFASGGKITLAPGAVKRPGRVRENVKADLLGIRFFRSEDVGIKVAETPAGLTVTKVRLGSRFAAFDVRAGDVVTLVDNAPTDSAKDFRRRLRQAVVAEHGVFRLLRGGEPINRVVSFRDVILPK